MGNDRKSFLMYKDWKNLLCSLEVKQKGELLDGVFKFQCDGEISDFDGDKGLQGILNFFISTFEQDNEKYNETCKKNKRNIEKRWNNTTEYDRIQSNTNDTDNDNDKDKDNDNDNVSDNESDNDNGGKLPTLQDIKNYVAERGNKIDAEKFFDYYLSNGWKGCTDWKAKVRYWERTEQKQKTEAKDPYATYDINAYEEMLKRKVYDQSNDI